MRAKSVGGGFIGGSVTTLLLMLLAPSLGLTGLVVGFVLGGLAGYLAYDLPQTREGLRLAWIVARRGLPSATQVTAWVRNTFFRSRPGVWLFCLAYVFCLWCAYFSIGVPPSSLGDHLTIVSVVLVIVSLVFALWYVLWLGMISVPDVIPGFVPNDSFSSNRLWYNSAEIGNPFARMHAGWFIATLLPLPVFGVLLVVTLAIAITYCAFWLIPKFCGRLLWGLAYYSCFAVISIARDVLWPPLNFCGQLLWRLACHIYSDRRLACGVSGTLGGWSAYWAYHDQMATYSSVERLGVVAIGGALGAGIGFAASLVVSRRGATRTA